MAEQTQTSFTLDLGPEYAEKLEWMARVSGYRADLGEVGEFAATVMRDALDRLVSEYEAEAAAAREAHKAAGDGGDMDDGIPF